MLFTNKRFTMRFGRYLNNDTHIDNPAPATHIDINQCYALLGESHALNEQQTSQLQHTIQQIISLYEKQTGHWLEPEQVALAAIQHQATNQAEALQPLVSSDPATVSELHCSSPTSFLDIVFLANALHRDRFSTQFTPQSSEPTPSCHRELNVRLDDFSMSEIETSGRELREHCLSKLNQQGITPNALQANWRLRMRYASSDTRLLLKCMPIEMMREVFETQHKSQFGFVIQDDYIIVEALEIEIKLHHPAQPSMPSDNPNIELLMSEWHSDSSSQNTWIRNKTHHTLVTDKLSFLICPILHEILSIFITKPADLSPPNFFIRNIKKEVDEVAIPN